MEIELCGYKVQIDEEDYDRVMALKWGIDKSTIKTNGNKLYFYHSFWNEDKTKHYRVALHRYLLGLTPNDGKVCDHINGDTQDNRRCNLRICTITENNRNARTPKTNTTGYKGVDYRKKKHSYRARISVSDKSLYLGSFKTAEEAYAAYCEASKKYHGDFGRVK